MDLDHFKTLNDHHGHEAGDRVLEQTAAILREVSRKSDFVVRWGGEEFLVVSRFVDRLGAAVFAERLRSAIAQHSFDVAPGVQLQQTCSIGFASIAVGPGLRQPGSADRSQDVGARTPMQGTPVAALPAPRGGHASFLRMERR